MNVVQRLIARMSFIPLDKPTIRIQTRESWRLTLDEWRKDETLVAESIKLSKDQTFKAQVDVLRVEHPFRWRFAEIGVSPDDRAAHQARAEGYELCLAKLEAFSKPFKSIATLRETFTNPEPEKRK